MLSGLEKRTARKIAQHKIPLTICARCGAPAENRHHPDHSKPLEVIQFCRLHHLEEDIQILKEMGLEGAKKRWANLNRTRLCLNCGKQFQYTRARQTTCSRQCGNLLAWKNRGGQKNQTESAA